MRGGSITQYPLNHELRRAIGIHGCRGRVFGHRHYGRLSVDGSGGGEYEVAYAVSYATLNQTEAVCHVVRIVVQRPLDGVWHHDTGGEVNDRIDLISSKRIGNQASLADVALYQRHV